MSTETHYLKEELYQLVQRDRSIFEFLQSGSLDGIWYWDLENPENEWISPQFWTTLGYDPKKQKHLASEWQDLINPEDLQVALDNFRKHCADPNHPYDQVVRYRHKNGSTVWVRCRGIAIRDEAGNPIRMLGAHNELTKQKQTEEMLRKSENKFRLLFESLPQLVWTCQPDGPCDFLSSQWVKYTGIPAAAQLGYGWLEQIHPDDREQAMTTWKSAFATGSDFCVEFRIRRHDGVYRWFNTHAVLLRDLDGRPTKWYGSNTDIDDRKQAEQALRESENKFRSFAEQSFVGMHLIQDGVFQYVNPRFAQIFGYSVEECEKLPFRNLVFPEDLEVVEEQIRRRISSEVDFVQYKFRGIKKNREIIDVEIYGSTISYEGKPAAVGTVLDITDRKRAEVEKRILQERLHNAEKMEVLGVLAGRVAHDLNNVLGVLSGYSELLTVQIPEGNPLKEYATTILKSSGKAAAIVEDLLTLTRRGVRIMEIVKFNKIIANLLATPEFDKLVSYHPNVIVRTDLAKDLLNISGSPVHLEKTVFNLVSNAVEAIAGGGKVIIKTENRYIDKAIEGFQTVAEGEYVVLTVSDTGKGIPASELKNIYEPFYTKKSMGRSGTGLGLAIVQGAVQDHNGYIDVQSTEENGTTFTVYFPATREKATAETQKTPVDQYMGHGETVLVVDDVKEQREVATTLLTRLGYSVNAVSSGEDAVEYLKSNKADILVLDMIMEPGIDGLDTYKLVLEINPLQKAVIVSGFSETDRSREAQKLGAGPYVKKPYMMETIGIEIRDELGRK